MQHSITAIYRYRWRHEISSIRVEELPLYGNEKWSYQALSQQEQLGHQVHNASTPESTGNENKDTDRFISNGERERENFICLTFLETFS